MTGVQVRYLRLIREQIHQKTTKRMNKSIITFFEKLLNLACMIRRQDGKSYYKKRASLLEDVRTAVLWSVCVCRARKFKVQISAKKGKIRNVVNCITFYWMFVFFPCR